MPIHHRLRKPGGTYFFTVNLARPGGTALADHINFLREAYRVTTVEHPIDCKAMVIFPDHIHAVWTLPPGDANFSRRWQKIEARFTHVAGLRVLRTRSMVARRQAGQWQRRFCEHLIRDPDEEARAVSHCLTDPVRLGLVERPSHWPFSTIHRDLRTKVGAWPILRDAA